MVDVLPRQLADVDEAVHAAEVDERTERDDRRDHAGADVARLEVGEEVLALLLLRLLQVAAAGEHDVVAVLVELDDLGLQHAPDVGLQVTHPAQLDERRRQEARRPMSMMRPPLTTSMTGPSTTPSDSLILSIVPQARSYCARFLESSSRPSLSSLVRTSASSSSPIFTTSKGLTSLRMRQLAGGDDTSDLYPMSSRTSSLSIFTTVPLTIWPSSTSTSVPAMASSNDCPGRPR